MWGSLRNRLKAIEKRLGPPPGTHRGIATLRALLNAHADDGDDDDGDGDDDDDDAEDQDDIRDLDPYAHLGPPELVSGRPAPFRAMFYYADELGRTGWSWRLGRDGRPPVGGNH